MEHVQDKNSPTKLSVGELLALKPGTRISAGTFPEYIYFGSLVDVAGKTRIFVASAKNLIPDWHYATDGQWYVVPDPIKVGDTVRVKATGSIAKVLGLHAQVAWIALRIQFDAPYTTPVEALTKVDPSEVN